MFNDQELKNINEKFFKGLYLQNNKLNTSDNLIKLNKLKKRLTPYINEKMNVLDVGAGEAWAMDYFQKKKCNYFAIEAIPRLADSIVSRGGVVIGRDLYQNLNKYKSNFDIIIFRHIIEHLLDPKLALETLGSLLKNNGCIYLALPNAEQPSKNIGLTRGFRISFLRPVHISYFHPNNILRIANYTGLDPIVVDTSGEIFMLLRHSNNNQKRYPNLYVNQKNVFKKTAKKYFIFDFIRILKDIPKALIKRALHL